MKNTDSILTFDTPPPKPATHPANEKLQDSLLNKMSFTEAEGILLVKILENYVQVPE
jgi:hypothetical protein